MMVNKIGQLQSPFMRLTSVRFLSFAKLGDDIKVPVLITVDSKGEQINGYVFQEKKEPWLAEIKLLGSSGQVRDIKCSLNACGVDFYGDNYAYFELEVDSLNQKITTSRLRTFNGLQRCSRKQEM